MRLALSYGALGLAIAVLIVSLYWLSRSFGRERVQSQDIVSVAVRYFRRIHRENPNFFGVWPLESRVELGDFGELNHGGGFEKVGNIAGLGIEFSIEREPDTTFTIVHGVRLSQRQSPESATATAIDVAFTDPYGVYLEAKGRIERINNIQQLGARLKLESETKKWDLAHVVVTTVFQADSMVAFMAGGSEASLSLEADKPPPVNLLSAKLKVKAQSNIAVSVLDGTKTTPLIGLAQVRGVSLSHGRKEAPQGDVAQHGIRDDEIFTLTEVT